MTTKRSDEKQAVLLRETATVVSGGVGLQDIGMMNIDLEDRLSITKETAISDTITIIIKDTTEIRKTKMEKNATKNVNQEVLNVRDHQHPENLTPSMKVTTYQSGHEGINHDHGIIDRRVIMGGWDTKMICEMMNIVFEKWNVLERENGALMNQKSYSKEGEL